MTALSIFSEDLALSAVEQRFVSAMLSASPAAASGELINVSMATLAAAVKSELEPEELEEPDVQQILLNGAEVVLAGLLRQARLLAGADESTTTSFRVLDEIRFRKGAELVEVRLGQAFLQMLTYIADNRRVQLF
ncbi:hypothetical protein A8H39_01615 [Paraburkholderia fungorum]|uniref:hypothetical protein n=1 Tax=Paraburkholderia fungorum TaxID=134537 RepID=UPI0004899050|nr:hypothetical protein [Paraburkholderia fungorum]MBB5546656.1 hypothetical protein [Paraburkholderia fungorum]PNE59869.1 hypothetical protein A8H39_01615 [Paraburkholderia fungorum]